MYASSSASFVVDEADRARVAKRYADGAAVELSVHERRNEARLRYYWAVLGWAAANVPDELEGWRFGPPVWHEFFKGRYGVTSIAFDNLDEKAFAAYVDWLVDEIARIWGVEPFQIREAVVA